MTQPDSLLGNRQWLSSALLALSAAAVLLRIASEAWVGEDALITFRTIENFVNGYGLRWNIDERVQVYTHPLWMLVNAAAYAVTREIPSTLTSVSLGFAVGAYLLVAWRLRWRPVALLVGFFLPLVTSRTLVLYGTSGFETPLAYFLLAAYALLLLPGDGSGPVRWGLLSFCAGLATLNRPDHLLLYGPSLMFLSVACRKQVKWKSILLGLSPLILWFVFALVYYGSPLPNTARAKLSPEIPVSQYVQEGVLYTANLVRWDPVAAIILVSALAVSAGAVIRRRTNPGGTCAGRLAALGAGIWLYGGYILLIGGGFLSGRFWAAPLFAAVLIVALGGTDAVAQWKRSGGRFKIAALAAAAVLLVTAFIQSYRLESHAARGPHLARSAAHLYLKPDLTWAMTDPAEAWWELGLKHRRRAQMTRGRFVTTSGTIGFEGLAAGPQVTIIDFHALADPLLVRLPLADAEFWRVGHLARPIPRGYEGARRTGSFAEMDPRLREYYRHLRLVVSGPVFDRERLLTIVNFQLGRYDHLLEK